MLSNEVIGRNTEFARLDRCMEEERPQLVIVYGRRRVGKTFLIDQYFHGRFDFKLTGMYNAGKEIQLLNFSLELNRQSGSSFDAPSDWTRAFDMLRNYLCSLPENEKHVVFFDEMPWLDNQRSNFLQAFEFFWNDFGCTMSNLVFIVCGSATSWMQSKIADNKGGLFDRQTCSLFLKPFTLKETEQYLESRGIFWSRYDIAQCYMVMGGIPYYLSLLRSDLSLIDNIDNLFFRKRAELWDEFDHLYQTLFSNSRQYIRVAETLSHRRSGMTRSEIVKQTGMNDNSSLTEILDNLAASDFIRTYRYFGKKKQDTLYQLSDYYSLFYFRFIHEQYGRDEHFWSHSFDDPSHRAWAGLTFELICMDHIEQIKQKLSILGILSEEPTWFIRADQNPDVPKGAQIDLLIDRRDHVINICEIKYTNKDFKIDKQYYESLQNKIDAFRKATGTTRTLQLTMITTFGVAPNKYSNMVVSQVMLDDLYA